MKELLLRVIKQINKPFALLLSGGIDSSILAQACKLLNKDFTCYVTGLQGSHDIMRAEKAAGLIKIKLVKIIITKQELINNYKSANLLGVNGFVNQSIATTLYSALKAVKENIVMTGQGADELFYGYKAFQCLLPDYKLINKLRQEKLDELRESFINRDLLIADHFGKELINPYMKPEFVKEASKLSAKDCLNKKQVKIPLRLIGKELGLPEELLNTPKKAMQYGSGFNKILIKSRKSLNT